MRCVPLLVPRAIGGAVHGPLLFGGSRGYGELMPSIRQVFVKYSAAQSAVPVARRACLGNGVEQCEILDLSVPRHEFINLIKRVLAAVI